MYMLTSDTLEPGNVWHVLAKKLSKKSLNYQNFIILLSLKYKYFFNQYLPPSLNTYNSCHYYFF